MALEQLRIGADNFCYIIFSLGDGVAAVVDPSFDAAKPLAFLSSHNLELLYIVLTHHHADHCADAPLLRQHFPSAKIVSSREDAHRLGITPDVLVTDGSTLRVADIHLDFLLTPGHTPGSICILVDNTMLLTGDTLFIGDCGRTDLAGGSLKEMFNTLQKKILPLPDEVMVYPGHDYGEKPFDSLGNQKKTNKTLRAKTLQEFSMIP